MLESIYVGMTGLLGYSRGLRVIANNTANMNTPGFKSSSLQFADLYYSGRNLSGGNASQNYSQVGFGLDTAGTTLSFKQGELRQTGNELDIAVDGQGLFVLQDAEGKISYTRAGQFKFDTDGVLVSRLNGEKVMGLDAGGNFVAVTLAGQMMDLGKPSSRFKLAGNLPNTTTEQQPKIPVDSKYTLHVMDAAGAIHTLTPRFTRGDATSGNIPVTVELLDGTTVVSTGQMVFSNGKPTPESSTLSMTYTPAGQAPMALTLDLTEVVYWAGEYQVETRSQDGVGAGALSGVVFDDNGTMKKTYANGQTLDGTRLALARFDSPDAVGALGDNQFEVLNKDAWHVGVAGQGAFGSLASGKIEISNVDLSQEFSDLVIMQRGYQASSQVISTANEMLQELFSMRSK